MVDDRSVDNTSKVVSENVEAFCDRVNLVKHVKSLGKFEALNTGQKIAKGNTSTT